MGTLERKFGAGELLGQFPQRGGHCGVFRPPAARNRLGAAEVAEPGPDEGVAGQVLGGRVQRLPSAVIGVGGDTRVAADISASPNLRPDAPCRLVCE